MIPNPPSPLLSSMPPSAACSNTLSLFFFSPPRWYLQPTTPPPSLHGHTRPRSTRRSTLGLLPAAAHARRRRTLSPLSLSSTAALAFPNSFVRAFCSLCNNTANTRECAGERRCAQRRRRPCPASPGRLALHCATLSARQMLCQAAQGLRLASLRASVRCQRASVRAMVRKCFLLRRNNAQKPSSVREGALRWLEARSSCGWRRAACPDRATAELQF